MGRLTRKPAPLVAELGTPLIAWVKPGKYIRILGIPFFEKYDTHEFWIEKYDKMKGFINRWCKHGHQSIIGRNILVNSYVYGRFRYFIQAIDIPHRMRPWLRSPPAPGLVYSAR